MKIFLDTADIHLIKEAYETGLIDGVTTNPSLILKSGRTLYDVIHEIVNSCPSLESVSAEVVGETTEDMLSQAKEYYSIHPMVTIKLPCTPEGLKACKSLSSLGIKTNVTLVFSVGQAILAAKSGATYISPFIGRMDDWVESNSKNLEGMDGEGSPGISLVEEICQVIDEYKFETQVLSASIRSVLHIEEAAIAGTHAVTTPAPYFWELYKHELTDTGLKRFENDWKKALESVKSSSEA